MKNLRTLQKENAEIDYNALSYLYNLLELKTYVNANANEIKAIKRSIQRHTKSIKMYIDNKDFSSIAELEIIMIDKGLIK